jgi:hypothetical protein
MDVDANSTDPGIYVGSSNPSLGCFAKYESKDGKFDWRVPVITPPNQTPPPKSVGIVNGVCGVNEAVKRAFFPVGAVFNSSGTQVLGGAYFSLRNTDDGTEVAQFRQGLSFSGWGFDGSNIFIAGNGGVHATGSAADYYSAADGSYQSSSGNINTAAGGGFPTCNKKFTSSNQGCVGLIGSAMAEFKVGQDAKYIGLDPPLDNSGAPPRPSIFSVSGFTLFNFNFVCPFPNDCYGSTLYDFSTTPHTVALIKFSMTGDPVSWTFNTAPGQLKTVVAPGLVRVGLSPRFYSPMSIATNAAGEVYIVAAPTVTTSFGQVSVEQSTYLYKLNADLTLAYRHTITIPDVQGVPVLLWTVRAVSGGCVVAGLRVPGRECDPSTGQVNSSP